MARYRAKRPKIENYVKELRLRKNLTLQQLADLAEVNLNTINEFERGLRRPWPKTLKRIADALGVESTEKLFPPIGENPAA